jgi:hypothetical protein
MSGDRRPEIGWYPATDVKAVRRAAAAAGEIYVCGK